MDVNVCRLLCHHHYYHHHHHHHHHHYPHHHHHQHGIGQQKRSAMSLARSPSELKLMTALKSVMDPNGILNPGKVLPDV
jgi:FAD/FMN-containing dehydrogenase